MNNELVASMPYSDTAHEIITQIVSVHHRRLASKDIIDTTLSHLQLLSTNALIPFLPIDHNSIPSFQCPNLYFVMCCLLSSYVAFFSLFVSCAEWHRWRLKDAHWRKWVREDEDDYGRTWERLALLQVTIQTLPCFESYRHAYMLLLLLCL